jgi:hypothetical protein
LDATPTTADNVDIDNPEQAITQIEKGPNRADMVRWFYRITRVELCCQPPIRMNVAAGPPS